jgi:hypothetical protein
METWKLTIGCVLFLFLIMIFLTIFSLVAPDPISKPICPDERRFSNISLNGTNYKDMAYTTEEMCRAQCLTDRNCDGWNYVNNVPSSPDSGIINSCQLKKTPFRPEFRYGTSGGTVVWC